jgi:hypothetical protein
MTLRKREDRESIRSHWLENLISNRLLNFLRADYTINELGNNVKIFMFQDNFKHTQQNVYMHVRTQFLNTKKTIAHLTRHLV